MKILSFDTVMKGCSVAVVDAKNRNYLFSKQTEMERGQAEILVPMIEGIIEEFGITFQDLDIISTTIGPGSFTGVRVGLATAKAMGMALDIPVVGVTSFEAIVEAVIKEDILKLDDSYNLMDEAHSEFLYPLMQSSNYIIDSEAKILVALDTKRSDFYVQTFSADGNPETEATTINPNEVCDVVPDGVPFIIAGDVTNSFIKCMGLDVSTIHGHGCKKLITISSASPFPNPFIVGHLGYYKYIKYLEQSANYGNAPTKYPAPSPLYIRPPDAKLPTKCK